MKIYKTLFTFAAFSVVSTAMAQQARPSSSIYLLAQAKTDVVIPFRPSDEGLRLPVRWGMDVAWNNEQNMRKGINFSGRIT